MEKIGSAFWEGAFDEYSAAHAAAGLMIGNVLRKISVDPSTKIIILVGVVIAFELFETYYFKHINHPSELDINSILDIIIGVAAGLTAIYA